MAHLIGWKPRFSDVRVASYRLRCLNPLISLRARGLPIELYSQKHSNRYKAVVYSKVYDRETYQEALSLKQDGVRIGFDLCDNHFYSTNDSNFWRQAGNDICRMIGIADDVVASSQALADEIERQVPVSKSITVIGDGVESEINLSGISQWKRGWYHFRTTGLLRQIQAKKANGIVPLVWFGNHGSPQAEGGMGDLLKIRTLLEFVSRQFPISLTVISNSKNKFLQHIQSWSIPTTYVEWDPVSFLPILRSHCIAVIPIASNPFTRCKTNNRLALALHCGLAVVADSVPSFLEFSESCFLDNWKDGLVTYLQNPDLRQKHVAAGQAVIEKSWTTEKIADQWELFFRNLLG
jgi:hypothetical protein